MKPIITSFRNYTHREVEKLIDQAYVAGMHDVLCVELKNIPEKNLLDFAFECAEESFGIKREEITKKTRKRTIVDIRTIIYWTIYPNFGSLSEIGAVFNQDHCTVLYRISKYPDLFSSDIYFRNKATLFQSVINKKLHKL